MPHDQQARTEGLESHKHRTFRGRAGDVQHDDGHLRKAPQLLQLRLHPAQDVLQHVRTSQAQALEQLVLPVGILDAVDEDALDASQGLSDCHGLAAAEATGDYGGVRLPMLYSLLDGLENGAVDHRLLRLWLVGLHYLLHGSFHSAFWRVPLCPLGVPLCPLGVPICPPDRSPTLEDLNYNKHNANDAHDNVEAAFVVHQLPYDGDALMLPGQP